MYTVIINPELVDVHKPTPSKIYDGLEVYLRSRMMTSAAVDCRNNKLIQYLYLNVRSELDASGSFPLGPYL